MRLSNLFLPMLLIITVGMSSCSRRAELLDTIPAESRMVVTINVDELCSQSGLTLTSDGVKADPRLQGKLSGKATWNLNLLSRLKASDAADISSVAFVLTGDNKSYATLHINGYAKLKDAVAGDIAWGEDINGFHTGTTDSGTRLAVVASDTQAWIANMETGEAVSMVKDQLDGAKKARIGELEGISQALGAASTANLALAQQKMGKDVTADQESKWNVMSLNAGEEKLNISWTTMLGDGKEMPVKGLKEINPAVLSYIPSYMNAVFAAGLTPDFDWSVLTDLAFAAGGFQAQAALSVITPYLQSIDGTVMLAAAAADGNGPIDFDPSTTQFILMAHMSQEKIDQIMGMIRTMCFSAGITPRTEGPVMIVPQYGIQLYIGNVDGYFALSNFPIGNNRDNSLAPAFVNKEMAMALDIPSLSMLGYPAPRWGVKVEASMSGAKGQGEISLHGTDAPVLITILSTLL